MGQIIHGDCLEILPTLEDKSIGMVLADLPYGVTACHWDKRIDLDSLWLELKRLIQPKRACVFTATQPFTTDLINSNRDWFKYCWVWDKLKPTGHLDSWKRPLKRHEDIVIFGDKLPNYQPQLFQIEKSKVRPSSKNRSNSGCYGNFKKDVARTVPDGTGFPSTILPICSINTLHERLNSTQKPVPLFEYLIRTYTNEGDTVLDPTAGSMTTAIACLNTGRDYVCIEKGPDEYRKGLERVQAHIAAPKQQSLLEPTPEMKPAEVITQTSLF